MRKPETLLVKKIKEALYKRFSKRIILWKIHGSPYQDAGIPDLVGCLDGIFFGMEVKTELEKPSQLQQVMLKRIVEAGGHSFVVRSVEEALNAASQIMIEGPKSTYPEIPLR
jgi:hypothetical protein